VLSAASCAGGRPVCRCRVAKTEETPRWCRFAAGANSRSWLPAACRVPQAASRSPDPLRLPENRKRLGYWPGYALRNASDGCSANCATRWRPRGAARAGWKAAVTGSPQLGAPRAGHRCRRGWRICRGLTDRFVGTDQTYLLKVYARGTSGTWSSSFVAVKVWTAA
jgi:hypothetical protein